MGRILIDTRDIRDSARDLRAATGALAETRGTLNGAFRSTWFGPEGARFQNDWNNRSAWIGRMADGVNGTATGLDGYANQVDAEQARTALRRLAGWKLRVAASFLEKLRRCVARTIAAIRNFFGRLMRLLGDIAAMLARVGIAIGRGIVIATEMVSGALNAAWTAIWNEVCCLNWAVPFVQLLTLHVVLTRNLWSLGLLPKLEQKALYQAAMRDPSVAPSASSPCEGAPKSLEDALKRIEGLDPGEFQIVDDGHGHLTVLMRGLHAERNFGPNSKAEVALEQAGFGPYSAQVEAALARYKQEHYPNTAVQIGFIGHSQGGMAARNIVADQGFFRRIGATVGPVLTVDSPVDGKAIPKTAQGQVWQFNNVISPVSKFDGGLHGSGEYAANVVGQQGDLGSRHSATQFNGGRHLTGQDRVEWEKANAAFAGSLGGDASRAYEYSRNY